MFAGHASFEPGDVISDSDLMIPVFEIDWHNGHNHFGFLWNEYVWSPSMFVGMDQEIEDMESMHACSGGFGAAVNCRLNLVNVEDTEDTFGLSMSGVSSESPGAGAFTPYGGRQFQATKRIPPGMELYASYGESYFKSRDAYYMVPLRQNYKNADKFLENFQSLREAVPALSTSSRLSEALYDLILNDFPYKSRNIYALPTNMSQIDHILATGGTRNATYNESIRELDWLEEHGQCMDNIKDGISTLPHAGRGAFANRFIPKGGLVAPLPLIHIGDRNILTMYEAAAENDKGKIVRNVSLPYHKQLLLNYCFGHADTSLLLCPYGLLTALINHSHQRPNAKITWSASPMRHPEWFNETYHAWHKTKHTGLSFDVVALRDIQEDEEILIDYGVEWETAWQEHLATFDVPRRGYVPAFEMNKQVDQPLKTIYEIDYEHDEGIFTFCRKTIVDMALGEEDALSEDENFREEVQDPMDEGCYPCRIVHRNHNDSYIAELFYRKTKDHKSGMWEVETDTVAYALFDVPRDTFYFHDAYYRRDHHQYWSFRHDMRIPDSMLPDAWRDSLHRSLNGNISGSSAEWLQDDDEEVDEGSDDGDDAEEEYTPTSHYGAAKNTKKPRKKSEGSSPERAAGRDKDEL